LFYKLIIRTKMRLIDFEKHILRVTSVNYFFKNQFTGLFYVLHKNQLIEGLNQSIKFLTDLKTSFLI